MIKRFYFQRVHQIFQSVSYCTLQIISNRKMSEHASSNEIKEGKAEVLTPKSVFYNPVQEFNRDLTIAVISEYAKERHENKSKKPEKKKTSENGQHKLTESEKSEADNENMDVDVKEGETAQPLTVGASHPDGIRILEGLSASGLRSVRFGLEIPGVKEIVANDFDENAVSFIERNIAKNNLEGIVKSNCGDAAMVMYQNKGYQDRFDVIDLDPYGSPSVFLDGAVQAVHSGGLLCVTCTDMAVMCGNYPETCYSKYGSIPLKAKYCHEMALRIILQAIESAANRYSRYIVPVLSLSADFYIRVFVKVYLGQSKVRETVTKLSYVYHCPGCGTHTLQKLANKVPTKGDYFKLTPTVAPTTDKLCQHCGFKQHMGGPFWSDPIHDQEFVQKVIKRVSDNPAAFGTADRIVGMLSMMGEELGDVPLYYKADEICNVLHCIAPSMVQFRSALLNAGYRCSLTHACKNSHKTDAPSEVIWDIMRCWVKDHPVKAERLKEGTPAKAILEKEPATDISFVIHPEANPKSRQEGLLRWQLNPEPDWGPKARAKKSDNGETQSEKRDRSRGKRKEKQGDRSHLKQYSCKRFKEGDCEKGDDCCYNHKEQGSS